MQTYTRMLAVADAVEVAMAVPRPPFVPGNASKRGGANECHFGIEL